MKDTDGNVVECEVLETHMKESVFQKSVPILPTTAGAFFGFLNICPGTKIKL